MKTYNGKVENSLYYCAKGICQSCHYRSESDCKGSLIKDAAKEEANDQRLIESQLETIQKQKAEIERLTEELDGETVKNMRLGHEIERLEAEGLQLNRIFMDFVNKQKFEAIKEFAERLCDGRVSNDPVVIAVKTELQSTMSQVK